MEKHVLMIAYHYPPCRGSSGLQRTLSFSRYLPALGWNPIVLSAALKAYPQIGKDQLEDIPSSVTVKRAFALDTARHLSWRGRYLSWTALPDRWVSWLFGAVPAGLRLIRAHRPNLLWSTYPIATAHLVAGILHRLTRIPWVADFRDPMTEIDPLSQQRWPADPNLWKARMLVEQLAVEHSACSVFVTPGARQIYAERYPKMPDKHWAVIANGYDEESFASAEQIAKQRQSRDRGIVLLHSGILYPTPDRDPSAFFSALAMLRSSGAISAPTLRIVLRASEHEEHHRRLIRQHGVEEFVFLEPPIPYREALAEMLNAHGLLLFQGRDSNLAIPAKLYEYLRTRRPIFALVDEEGETAKALYTAKVGNIVSLNSAEMIAASLQEFLQQLAEGKAPVADVLTVKSHSRESRVLELARLFDDLTG